MGLLAFVPTNWLVCRQEKEAACVFNQSSLVLLLKANLETCTKMLTSEDKGLSLASSAKMLLYRARCYLQQRELSLALTDLAYAFALQPCSLEVMYLELGLDKSCLCL